jgi:BASS family bile acid:Na+ symporter
MPELIPLAVKVTVFGLMLVVGLDCTLGDLRRQLRRVGLVSTVTLAQFTLVPLVAVLVCGLLGLRGAVAASLVLVCCCPAGTISNSYTFISRGSTALSVALTAVSCLLATLATPAALWLFVQLIEMRGETLHVPAGPLIEQLALQMALPIFLGFLVRHRFPSAVLRNLGRLRGLSFALLIGLIALIALSVPVPTLLEEFRSLLVPALLLTALLLPVGLVVARMFRLDPADRKALVFEFPCQNLAVVALVGVGVLGQPGLAIFAVLYFVVQALALLVLAGALARRGKEPTAPGPLDSGTRFAEDDQPPAATP